MLDDNTDSDKKPVVKASYYVCIILEDPWRVPVVYGHRPFTPNEHSTSREKGLYGLWMLLLFKPWRRLREDILLPCWPDNSQDVACDPWEAIYRYYVSWAEALETEARKTKETYADLSCVSPEPLKWNSNAYWSVMIAPVLHNMRLTLTRNKELKMS